MADSKKAMSELRRDPIIGRWVIVETTENSLAPQAYDKEYHTFKQETVCQFCTGREKQTPPEVAVLRLEGTAPDSPGWFVRVVPNKFPALKIEGELDKRGLGIYDMSNGVGAHEVLIETPDHRKSLADFSIDEMVNVLKLYKNRFLNLAQDKRFRYILIFKNYGQSAGASLEHAHSQIIALPMVPKDVLEELEGSRTYYQYRGRCVYCDLIQQEYEDKERIIADNDSFIAFCPYAPRYPFESWIFPRKHHSDFCSLDEQQQYALAGILKDILSRIKTCLSDPSYNFYLHVAPVNYEHQKGYHWHIEIVPQLKREAGFEWGTSFFVVNTSPSEAAKYLREAKNK